MPTITNAQALDVALCWGWIDGIRKSFDERAVPSGAKIGQSGVHWRHVDGRAARRGAAPDSR